MKNKKVTRASIKSFIKKNRKSLYIKVKGRFDGMVDCVVSDTESEFIQAGQVESGLQYENNLGVMGLWLVGRGRDYFDIYEDDGYTGIEYLNSCGSGIVVIKK